MKAQVSIGAALMALVFATVAAHASEPGTASGVPSAVETFKSFLSRPPIVRALVFSERLPADPRAPSSAPLGDSQRFRYYEALWQSDSYFLREAPNLESNALPTSLGVLAARVGDECWFHYGRGYHNELVEYSAEHAEPMNHVCQSAYINSDVLRQVLMLGLMHSEIGSIEWLENKFQVRKQTDEFRAAGELIASSTGLPDSLRVTYTGKNGDIHWLIRYTYPERMAQNKLPETISCFWVDGDTEVERAEFRIYQLSTRHKFLAPDAFSPLRFVTNNAWKVLIYSNDSIYATLPGGGLRMIQNKGKAVGLGRRPGDPSPVRLLAAYTVWAGANFWILVLGVRASLKPKETKKARERKE
jgi:hypothetical protein